MDPDSAHFTHNDNRCWNCGKPVQMASAGRDEDKHETPEPGSLCVCLYCSSVSVFTADLHLRKLADEEWKALPLEYKLQIAITQHACRKAVRAARIREKIMSN
jgi:hypothetical protein